MTGGKTLLVLLLCLTVVSLVVARKIRRNMDEQEEGCDAPEENHVCCRLVNRTYLVVQWKVHPCNGSEDDRHEDDDDDHQQHHHDDHEHEGPVCYKKVEYNVTVQLCYRVCCDGWVMDADGNCTVPSTDLECENGGTPDGSYCHCSSDFTGRQCETPVCSPKCANSGECMAENGQAKCVCSEGFVGEQCEKPVCGDECHNGGSCVGRGYYSECECSPGYTGKACEHVVRPGTCPSIRDMGDPRRTLSKCQFDDQCEDRDKCCNSRYGYFCVRPGKPTCLHNGIHYQQGQAMTKSACEKCTCVRPSVLHQSEDEFECYHIDCARLTCSSVIHQPGKCCPVCDGQLPPEPKISDCPTNTVQLSVQADKNIINVTETFKNRFRAYDHQKNILTVTFSHGTLRSCACNFTELEYHQVSVVSEPDTYGRQAICSFTVRILDIHSPHFRRCPTAITAFTDENISWLTPVASDNVGVNDVALRTRFANNTLFPAGHHVVEYHARDFHGNVAICRIPVSVYERGTSDPSLPINMRQESDDIGHHRLYIGIGAGVGALLVALLIGFAIISCRKIRAPVPQNAPPANGKKAIAFGNEVYSEGKYPLPYDNIAFKGEKGGPPPYKLDNLPPAYVSPSSGDYASIAVRSVAGGVANQLYMGETMSLPADKPDSSELPSYKKGESPPPSYRGAPSSAQYEEVDVRSVVSGVVTNQTYNCED